MKAKLFCLLAVFFAFVVCSFGVPKIPEKKPPKISLEMKAVEVKTILVQESNQIVFDDSGGGIAKTVIIDKADYLVNSKTAYSEKPFARDYTFVPYGVQYRSLNIRQLLHPPLAPLPNLIE